MYVFLLFVSDLVYSCMTAQNINKTNTISDRHR